MRPDPTSLPPSGATGPGAGSHVPALPARMVHRPRLEALLDAGVAAGHVVVSSTAGSGKTLLLAGWASRRTEPVAWLTVEPEDRDPGHLWGRVLAELRASARPPADAALARLRHPPRHDPLFVRRLIGAVDGMVHPLVLVLDDLHLIGGSPSMESLADHLRQGLGRLRLVIATRTDPTLPLQRLRLDDRLIELRSVDLGFTDAEAASLLAAHDVALAGEDLRALQVRTEGWAAGIRFAALALRGADDPGAVVAALAGDQRTVADYFLQEVVDGLGAERAEFLLRTSVVRRVCGDLADALTGRTDGHARLAELEQENLFLIALDDRRRWYRYHPLFAELLRHRLRSGGSETVRELHRRAAGWLVGRGDVLEGARHLRAAEEWPALCRLVTRRALPALVGAERPTLVELVAGVPPALVARLPEAAAAAAVLAYVDGDLPGAAAHLALAEAALPSLPPEEARPVEALVLSLGAVLAWRAGDPATQVRRAAAAGRLWERCNPADVPAAEQCRTGTDLVQAVGLVWEGDAAAEPLLRRTLAALVGREELTPALAVYVHGTLAAVTALGGRLREARREGSLALGVAAETGWSRQHRTAAALLGRAATALLEDDRAACRAALECGRGAIGAFPDRCTAAALELVDAGLALTEENPARARRAVAAVEDSGWPLPPLLAGWCRLVEAEACLAEGSPDRVPATLRALVAEGGASRLGPRRSLLLARAALACQDPEEALRLVEAPMTAAAPDLVLDVETWLVRAAAHHRLRRDAEARGSLGRALDVGAPEGLVRPFVTAARASPALVGMLRGMVRERAAASGGCDAGFAATLLLRLGGPGAAVSVPVAAEPLTDRERAVLSLLPTMMSNAELAAELFVSVNTVKVHLKSLYRKLGVSNRRHAVHRARELGLLSEPARSP